MLANPASKYRPFPAIDLPNRQWPGHTQQQAPRWCSSDLRDGNQALAEPMDNARKLQFYQLLLACGLRKSRWHFLPHRKPTLTLCVT